MDQIRIFFYFNHLRWGMGGQSNYVFPSSSLWTKINGYENGNCNTDNKIKKKLTVQFPSNLIISENIYFLLNI